MEDLDNLDYGVKYFSVKNEGHDFLSGKIKASLGYCSTFY